MAKTNKKYNSEVSYKNYQIEDDYDDYGYEIANAKRYNNRAKSQRKFKDTYDDEYWPTICATNWTGTLISQGFGSWVSVNIHA